MNEPREQQLADQLIEQLEAAAEAGTAQAKLPETELAAQLRESARVDLPPRNPDLPDLIAAELAAVTADKAVGSKTQMRWMVWVVAASLLVVVGWLSVDRMWPTQLVWVQPESEEASVDTDADQRNEELAALNKQLAAEAERSKNIEARLTKRVEPEGTRDLAINEDKAEQLRFEDPTTTSPDDSQLSGQLPVSQTESPTDTYTAPAPKSDVDRLASEGGPRVLVNPRIPVNGVQGEGKGTVLKINRGDSKDGKSGEGLFYSGIPQQGGQSGQSQAGQVGGVEVDKSKLERRGLRSASGSVGIVDARGGSGSGAMGGLGGGGGGREFSQPGFLADQSGQLQGQGRFPLQGQSGQWGEQRQKRTKYLSYRLGRNQRDLSNEQYQRLPENDFQSTTGASAVSTFSIDVDTASYANLRRFINDGQLPPPDAVRIEEMLNYFRYHDPAPVNDDQPFAVNMELAACPWNSQHQLLRVGLKGKEIETGHRAATELESKQVTAEELIRQLDAEIAQAQQKFGDGHPQIAELKHQLEAARQRKIDLAARQAELDQTQFNQRPPVNLVLLIDVSGSMNSPDKLPLLKQGFQQLIQQLGQRDRVTIVTYAGQAGVALEPTPGNQQDQISQAIDRLTPGGSTHGSAGIELAYQLAQQNFMLEGVNKVILATDGDLNVGVTADDALVDLIRQKCSEGVFLTVLGFGTGNLKDAKMEKLADQGNGIYAYIDSARESHKVLVEQMAGSLVTIAKDVKLQIEFNPAEVAAYRLIGYENRVLATEDFDNDRKDAGEIGAGHSVTALYELVPAAAAKSVMPAKGLKYQQETVTATNDKSDESLTDAAQSGELLTLAIRYKEPEANHSQRLEFTLANESAEFQAASDDLQFAAGVAAFGMHLRNSQHAGESNLEMVQQIVAESLGDDQGGYRAELLDLIRKVRNLKRR